MYQLGSTVSSGVQSLNLSNVEWVKKSGVYKLIVNDAMWRRNIRVDGSTWDSVTLTCLAYSISTKEQLGKINVMFGLPSKDANHLAFFLNFKNENGYYMPDPVHHQGTSKTTGKEFDFYTMPDLQNKVVYALVEFIGMSSYNGNMYPQYRLIGFSNEKAFSAYDLVSKAEHRNKAYQDFIDKLKEAQAQQSEKQINNIKEAMHAMASASAVPTPQPHPFTDTDDVIPF